MDEVILFRCPPDAARLVIFNLPKPPLTPITQEQLEQTCRQFGPLYECRIRYSYKHEEEEEKEEEKQDKEEDKQEQQPTAIKQEVLQLLDTEQKQVSPPSPVLQSLWAHVSYYSVYDAVRAQSALNNKWTLNHGSKIRVSFLQRKVSPSRPPQHVNLSFSRCVELMNSMYGFNNWSCSIRWIKPYDIQQHGEILAGQTAGYATDDELVIFQRAMQMQFKCSSGNNSLH